MQLNLPPISLYIHLPWCVQKCPYCDFNSHELKNDLPEEIYAAALLNELDSHLAFIQGRPLLSIFFGGGTPSLFSPKMIERILLGVKDKITLLSDIEITLEANPGTIDYVRFKDFHQAGINRLSLGIQSLQNDKLKILGRIHDAKQAIKAIEIAKQVGFENFNLDIMYGLPKQTLQESLSDLSLALSFQPTHFSWYQLTIEPNTFFHHQPPTLPEEDLLWEMQVAGQQLLQETGLQQYEVSAYASPKKTCRHNLNYWEFGDYLGIGAGAHSKLTDITTGKVLRFSQVKHPKDYLDASKRHKQTIQVISQEDLCFEFMLNALRLTQGFSSDLFTSRTGISLATITPLLQTAIQQGLLKDDFNWICPTEHGKKFLNNLTALFLPK